MAFKGVWLIMLCEYIKNQFLSYSIDLKSYFLLFLQALIVVVTADCMNIAVNGRSGHLQWCSTMRQDLTVGRLTYAKFPLLVDPTIWNKTCALGELSYFVRANSTECVCRRDIHSDTGARLPTQAAVTQVNTTLKLTTATIKGPNKPGCYVPIVLE